MIVGGGNSAGQAAVYLHDFAHKVWMLVRGPSLVNSMSRYLINRIAAIDNIEVLTNTQIIALSGTPHARIRRSRNAAFSSCRHRSSASLLRVVSGWPLLPAPPLS